MAQTTTLGKLIKDKFGGTLAVTSIGDIKIVITNDPDYKAKTWTVTATGASKSYAYPLFGNDALSLKDISVSLTYNGAKRAAKGLLRADLNFGGIDFDVEVALSKRTESFSLTSQLSRPASLSSVVSKLSASKAKAPGQMKETLIDLITMSIERDGKKGWTLASKGRLKQADFLPFASSATSLSLMIEYSGKKKLKLTRLGLEGETRIGKSGALSIGYTFGPKISVLSGKLKTDPKSPVVFEDVLKVLGLKGSGPRTDKLSTPKGLDMVAGELTLNLADQNLLVAGRNSLKEDAFIYVARTTDSPTLALGVATQKGWKMSDLSRDFAVVDKVLTFRQSFLALSTSNVSIESKFFPKLGAHTFDLTTGLNVGADLAMNKSQSSVLGKAVSGLLGGTPELLLQASIGPSAKDTTFSANLGNLDLHLKVPGSRKPATMEIKRAKMELSLEPSIAVSGDVLFPAPQGQTVEVTGAVKAEETKAGPVLSFVGHAHDQSKSLAPPKNATGLTLKDIGASFSIEPEAFVIGLDGSMWIEKESASFGFAFALPELSPTFLKASYSHLDLAPMFKVLCRDAKLPRELKGGISFSNLLIWSCTDPSGTCRLSDESCYDDGFAFKGDADIFNFPAHADLQVTTKGMSGSFSTGKAFGVPKVFTVADASDHSKGPQFAFSTSKTPYLHASYFVDVLGFSDTTSLELTNQGFSLSAEIKFKGEKISLDCVLGARSPGRYVASISASADFKRHPIDLGGGLKLKSVSISMSSKTGIFSVKAKAKYGPLPKSANITISLKDIAHRLDRLGKEIEKELGKIGNWF